MNSWANRAADTAGQLRKGVVRSSLAIYRLGGNCNFQTVPPRLYDGSRPYHASSSGAARSIYQKKPRLALRSRMTGVCPRTLIRFVDICTLIRCGLRGVSRDGENASLLRDDKRPFPDTPLRLPRLMSSNSFCGSFACNILERTRREDAHRLFRLGICAFAGYFIVGNPNAMADL